MALDINTNWRLPESEYFNVKDRKTGICIHHTVGGTAESTFNWWKNDSQMVGTAYIIDRDGTPYEVFDPECWAWQFGLRWEYGDKIAFEKRFIGIELASEGGLLEDNGRFYCFDRISARTEKPADEVFQVGYNYRGYSIFDRYEPEQIETLAEIINQLCDQFDIPRRAKSDSLKYYGEQIKNFEGIIGHAMVRNDKTDPAPMPDLWRQLTEACNLETDTDTEISEQSLAEDTPMTKQERDELFTHNIRELNKMNVAAGSMVKGLIMELERADRNTYIKLRDAEADGHIVHYDFKEGKKDLVKRIASALGFRKVTENILELRHG